jgi:uncharacterized protein YqfA (UPF0365 family)
MAFALPFIQIASAAIGAIGSISQGNAARKSAEYNANVMQRQAETTRSQGLAREEVQRAQARQQIGKQLAAGAESGVGLSGSSLDLLNASMLDSEMDAMNIRYERDLNATGLLNQAALTRADGKAKRNASYLSAAGSLLSGAGGYLAGGGKLPFGGTSGFTPGYASHVGMSV